MSFRQAARRLALSSNVPQSAATASRPSILPPRGLASGQRRQKWNLGNWSFGNWGGGGKSAKKIGADLDDPKKRKAYLEEKMSGSAEGSIFQDDIEASSDVDPDGAPAAPRPSRLRDKRLQHAKTPENMAFATDPNPPARIRWHRRRVIQMVRNNGEVPREIRIRMSERQYSHRSSWLPTSVKKLVMLSRQVAGKTLDDAITQMQWSKKKMAREIKVNLEEARDHAVVMGGMGLGRFNGETLSKPRKIKTKHGKWVEITDPTRIYVDQSWVCRGPWIKKDIDYKGRGRQGIIQHPSTSITFLLKEEKTRLREHEEKEAKKAAEGPWVHHPNRPIHGQRPYYTW